MDLETFKKNNQDYIQNKVNPFFETLLYDLLISKPDDIVFYIFFSIVSIKLIQKRSILQLNG